MDIMHNIVEVGGWIIVASLVVLVVMHPSAVAQLVTATSGGVTQESSILTGTNYH